MTDAALHALENRIRKLEADTVRQKGEIEAANLAICILIGDYARRLHISEDEALRRFEGFWSTPKTMTSDMTPVETDMHDDLLRTAYDRLLHNIRQMVRMTEP